MEKLTLHIKNMTCPSCISLLKIELENIGVEVEEVKLGEATIRKPDNVPLEAIEAVLNKHGFSSIADDEKLVVEDVKLAVLKLVERQSRLKDEVRNSDFIAQEAGRSYRTLTDLFSKHEGTTIERYIIQQKIKRTKELLREGELSLSQIAAQLGYSSVQHLSGQFKKVEGVSVSDYKKEVDKEAG
jgi:AraC family transcriptional regulator